MATIAGTAGVWQRGLPNAVLAGLIAAVLAGVGGGCSNDDEAASAATEVVSQGGDDATVQTAPAPTASVSVDPNATVFTTADGLATLTIGPGWVDQGQEGISVWYLTEAGPAGPVVVLATEPAAEASIESYTDEAVAQVMTLGDFEILAQGLTPGASGRMLAYVEYGGTMQGSEQMRVRQYLDINNGTAAVVTLTAPQADFSATLAQLDPYLLTLTVL